MSRGWVGASCIPSGWRAVLRVQPARLLTSALQATTGQLTSLPSHLSMPSTRLPPPQVLFITADPDAYSLQPENAIKVRGKQCCSAVMCMQPAALC